MLNDKKEAMGSSSKPSEKDEGAMVWQFELVNPHFYLNENENDIDHDEPQDNPREENLELSDRDED